MENQNNKNDKNKKKKYFKKKKVNPSYYPYYYYPYYPYYYQTNYWDPNYNQTQYQNNDKYIPPYKRDVNPPLPKEPMPNQNQNQNQNKSQIQPFPSLNQLFPTQNSNSNPNQNVSFGSDFIQIDITDSVMNGDKNPLDSIFKSLFGAIPKKQVEVEKTIKIKKTYDISSDYLEINKRMETLDDLIELSDLYDIKNEDKNNLYAIDLKTLYDIKPSLIELRDMIGMESVKKSIVRQVLYFLQGIEEQEDMLHMIITGSPGIGKTSLGMILSKLYFSMGILDKKPSINPITGKKDDFIFKIYKRSDLIGQYLGHTAIKTQKAIDECLGGVMFLDEAYSLGHDDKSDIYTKECLDTINQNLSENKKKFILIIAGYPDQLDKCFFSHNEGLKRRFAFRYHIDKYTSNELMMMLKSKIISNNWKVDENMDWNMITKLIETNNEMFLNYGGDIESWLLHIKIEHGVRIFGKHPKLRKIITIEDIEIGLKQFKIAKDNNNKKKSEFNSIYI